MILMRAYRLFLELVAFCRLVVVGRRIVLVDFDFTLAIHRKSKAESGWDLAASNVNHTLISKLKCQEYYIFTARGLGSRRDLRNWLNQEQLSVKGILCVGSTEGKIRIVRRLLRLGIKSIVWYDDLTDVNFDMSVGKKHDINIHDKNLIFWRI